MNENNLEETIEIICKGIDTDKSEVICNLLTKNNIEDILSGDISLKVLRAHIMTWIRGGKKKINGSF